MASKTKSRTKAAPQSRKEAVDQRLIRALGHPLRTRSLAILNERVASPNEIAQELGENLSQVSYHIKVLSECGFIELVNTEPRRGAVEHFYRGTRRALLPDEVLHQLPSGIQSGIIGEVLLEIVDDATASLRDGTFNRRDDCHLSWTPLVLDEEGWRGMASLLAETLDRLFDLQAESNERSAREDGSGIPATVAMMGFESSRAPAKGKAAGPDRP